MLILLVAASVVIISAISKDMLFDTKRSLVEADSRNLTASGLAWSQINIEKLSAAPAGDAIELNIEKLETLTGSLYVERPRKNSATGLVEITTRNRRGKMSIEQKKIYKPEFFMK